MRQEKIVYVNTLDHICGQYEPMVKASGWQVVNAPRPLPGAAWWDGPFLHGIFYAAGDPKEYDQQWTALDAWPVIQISNEEIAERLREDARGSGLSLEEIAEDWGSLGEAARACGYPYRDVEEARP